MAIKRLLMLLKPLDVYSSNASSARPSYCREVLRYLNDRILVHKNATNFCQSILKKKSVDFEAVFGNELSQTICDVDLVIAVGGDGTLLQASHFMDDSIPVIGVNSDPTLPEEVEKHIDTYDATRSTGYLCATTVNNFEQILDDILDNRYKPSELTRMSISINSKKISASALNDVLIAHPSPATVSRFSFRVTENGNPSPLLHCRSSGFRVCTAVGSTAAMLSSGGFSMPPLSNELQYIVREPISPGVLSSSMHGFVKTGEKMDVRWFCGEGVVYIDGSNLAHSLEHGDTIELSSMAPTLKVYLPHHLLWPQIH